MQMLGYTKVRIPVFDNYQMFLRKTLLKEPNYLATPGVIDSKELLETVSSALEKYRS